MKLIGFVLLVSVLALNGCTSMRNMSHAKAPEKIHVRAYIDGKDELKIQGNKMWYEHQTWEWPGKWQQKDEPTYINDVAWKPTWDGKISNPYQLSTPLPQKALPEARIIRNDVRGNVTVQCPNKSNDYTLTVFLDDDEPGGAEWYDFTIVFE